MIGIVFHEGVAPGKPVAHHFHGPHQGSCFPVAFAAKSIAIGHQTLCGDAGKLHDPMQVFKCIGIALVVSVFKEFSQSQFNLGSIPQ